MIGNSTNHYKILRNVTVVGVRKLKMFLVSRAVVRRTPGHRFLSLYSVENVLDEENRERTVTKFSNTRPIRLQPHTPARKAAVLIPLCVVDGKVSLLYTLRAPHLKSHRGQVSFPGGMLDVSDKSLEYTAIRETHEELGIKEGDIDVWGSGNMIVTRGDTCVLPVIGRIKGQLQLNELKINHHEVGDVFTVALENLCHPANLGFTQFRGVAPYSTPVFTGGVRRIWGLTAMITHTFLQCLLPSKAYKHKIHFVPPVKGIPLKR